MQIIKFNVRNQRLTRFTSGVITEGSYSYLKFEFNFKTEDWNTIEKKIAVFSYKGEDHEQELDEYNQCYVPKEVIHDPCFKVSLYGGDIPTNTVKIPVEPQEGVGGDCNCDCDCDETANVVFVPEISDKKVLSWTIQEVNDDLTVPKPIDLNPYDEWSETGNEVKSEYIWEPMQ